MLHAYKVKKLPKVYNDVKKKKKKKKPLYVMYITRRLHAFYMGKYELSFSKKALLKPMSSILDITSVQGRVNMAFTKTMNSN